MIRARQAGVIVRRFGADRRGAAAAEFALVVMLLTIPVLNVVDLGFYAFDRMQLDNAAQMAVQAAYKVCAQPSQVPAATKCTGLSAAVTEAAASTSLGTEVQVTGTTDVWFCVASNTWYASEPSSGTCASNAVDYLKVSVSYSYTPVFSAVSVAALLPSPMTRDAYVRLY